MRSNENTLSEIEQQRAIYLLNPDDMNYAMLAEAIVITKKSDMTPNSYIGVFGEINLVSDLINTEDIKEFTEIVDIQSQIEFPTRQFQQVCPATLEDELIEDSSYSE